MRSPLAVPLLLLSSLILSWLPPLLTQASATDLRTHAERTGYEETGRYGETEQLCRDLAARSPRHLRCFEWGRTPEGRPLLALAASADGTLEPAATTRARRPVLLVLGGIHAGEIDGKDAGLALLRDLTADPALLKRSLTAVTVVFVPVFNVDGHERFAPNQRPNQRGPRQTGFRATASNLNLNRDWLKAEAPEMAALLRLIADWDPTMLVDLHVTDGAKFEHDVALIVAPDDPRPHGLDEAARSLSAALMKRVAARGHLPLPFYPSFRKAEDPASGVNAVPPPPRFSTGYFAARNRLGILVETHSWRPYPHRVRTTRVVLEELLAEAVTGAAGWLAAARAADAAESALGGQEVSLAFEAEPQARTIDFRGYAFTREWSDLSGATYLRYDEQRPQLWKVNLHDKARATLTARAPRGGYLVPAAHAAWVGEKLRLHGISSKPLSAEQRGVPVQTFRAGTVEYARLPFEGRFAAKVTGQWKAERRDLPASSLYVPIAQPRARLLMHLLEPAAPDSLVSWGFFHAAFEQKEYMESYVAEEEARKMIAARPALRAELEAELRRDPTLAADPRRRLEFFYRRHPAWDERVNLYPVFKLERRPP